MKHPVLLLTIFVSLLSIKVHSRAEYMNLAIYGDRTKSGLENNECYPASTPALFKSINLADGGISAKQAAAIAKRTFGGSVMNVSKKGSVYRVKLLKDGRVRIVKVDAMSGSIVGGK